MNNKLKLMTIVGTRPEIIRLSEIIKKCDKYFDHILVNTMQNSDYELNRVFFDNFNLKKAKYNLEINNTNPGTAIADVITKTYDVMQKENPDAILILGDTNSALSSISAKKLRIPIFHLEAGNRSYDLNLPEEINRKIVDEISDINMPYSERARMNLIEEGKRNEWIIKTGSPLYEVIKVNRKNFSKSNILNELKIKKDEYFIVSLHRNENVTNPEKLDNLLKNIMNCSTFYNKSVVISLHPKTKDLLSKNNIKVPHQFIVSKPFDFFDYMCLQMNSFCVVSDSGSLAEESNILKFSSVSLRNSTERQEALELGNFILGNLDSENLINAINIIKSNVDINDVSDYHIDNVSNITINTIQSFTKKIKSRY